MKPPQPESRSDPRKASSDTARHQNRVTWIAVLFIIIVFACAYAVMVGFTQHEALQKCKDSGRRDCIKLEAN